MPSAENDTQALALARQFLPLVAERTDLLELVMQIIRRLEPCRHGLDFTSVVWNGKPYSFSAAQSRVVQTLWEAWETGTPDVRLDLLLVEAECDSKRLANVFKEHDAWGEMIVPGKARGSYRLSSD